MYSPLALSEVAGWPSFLALPLAQLLLLLLLLLLYISVGSVSHGLLWIDFSGE